VKEVVSIMCLGFDIVSWFASSHSYALSRSSSMLLLSKIGLFMV